MAQPLPQDLPEIFNASVKSLEIKLAYSKVLEIEQDANSEQDLVRARVIGYLIREGPSMRASEYVAEEVISCENREQLYKIGEMFIHHFIRAFKRIRRYVPTPSCNSSCSSFEPEKEQIRDIPCKNLFRNAKETALLRDGNQCLVTGRYDFEKEYPNKRTRLTHTKCTYIFPPSINMNISGANDNKCEYGTSFWAIMKCFGYEDIPKKLMGDGIHTLDNVMTLSLDMHAFFNSLFVWFEAVDGEENMYNIVAVHPGCLHDCEANPTTFTIQNPKYPLPNPEYLRIHAACCRVAQLSGATEYIENTCNYLDDIGVMSQDGSSAHALMFALQPLAQK